MDWKDLAPIIGKVAPILGTLIAGPGGAAVGSIIASTLGAGNTPEEVEKLIAADPQALVKIREIEASKEIRFKELVVDQAKHDLATSAADRDSARKREANTGDTFTPRALALLVTFGFFGVLAQLLIIGKPELGGDALLVMLGGLGTAWGSVVNYYFGSSSGSAAKTELLQRKE